MRSLLVLVSFGLLTGCGAVPRGRANTPASSAGGTGDAPSSLVPGGECWQGAVTFYADSLAGRPTASGEPYEPAKMTAAHRSLPFGTWLRVKWQGREVRVRVNDRGGPRGGADLSRAAAEQLRMIQAGRVQAQICSGG